MPVHDWTRVEAGIFHDFHHSWIEENKRSLNRGLHGTGYYAPPGLGANAATEQPATVVAFDLGECDGHRAYRQVRWFFVEQGDAVNLDGEPFKRIFAIRSDDALPLNEVDANQLFGDYMTQIKRVIKTVDEMDEKR